MVICACVAGCVRRRMTVCTNPPGALVYVDDYEIGTTPISHNFTYYGKRKIRLVKDGFETLTVMQPVPTPWYQIPPLDFVTENLIPFEIHDDHTLTYQLSPQVVVPTEQLLQRAEELRRGHLPMVATPSSAFPGTATGSEPALPVLEPTPAPSLPPISPGIGGQPVYPLPPRGMGGR
ncbi:MAG TPA: PEGA domain-containing protein [Thermoguttaceae bacterium]|nr:PEGA domain-containing protein [Thermoguttaceae bacterium]